MSPSPNIGGTCPPCPIWIDAPGFWRPPSIDFNDWKLTFCAENWRTGISCFEERSVYSCNFGFLPLLFFFALEQVRADDRQTDGRARRVMRPCIMNGGMINPHKKTTPLPRLAVYLTTPKRALNSFVSAAVKKRSYKICGPQITLFMSKHARSYINDFTRRWTER